MSEIIRKIPLQELHNEPDPRLPNPDRRFELEKLAEGVQKILHERFTPREQEFIVAIFDGILSDQSVSEVAKSMDMSPSRLSTVWNKFKRIPEFQHMPESDADLRAYIHGHLDLAKRDREFKPIIRMAEKTLHLLEEKTVVSQEEADEKLVLKELLTPGVIIMSQMNKRMYSSGSFGEILKRVETKYNIHLPEKYSSWADALAAYRKEGAS